MNIILFEPELFNGAAGPEAEQTPVRAAGRSGVEHDVFSRAADRPEAFLPAADERAVHIRKILGLAEGQTCRAGLLDGPAGEIRVEGYEEGGVRVSWTETGPPVGLYPLTLVVGYTRPISSKRILREAASLGVERLVFTGTETGEKSYREANLWKEESRWRRFLVDGLQQAGATVMPAVEHARNVRDALRVVEDALRAGEEHTRVSGAGGAVRLLLDNEIGEERLACMDLVQPGAGAGSVRGAGANTGAGARAGAAPDSAGRAFPVRLTVAAERGWTARERELFVNAGYRPVLLGSRILRTETACAAGVAVTLSRMGYL